MVCGIKVVLVDCVICGLGCYSYCFVFVCIDCELTVFIGCIVGCCVLLGFVVIYYAGLCCLFC